MTHEELFTSCNFMCYQLQHVPLSQTQAQGTVHTDSVHTPLPPMTPACQIACRCQLPTCNAALQAAECGGLHGRR